MATARRRAKAVRSLLPPVLLLPLLVALPAACGGARKDEAAVRTLLAREVEATNRRDLKALAEIWSQGADILLFDIGPPGRFRGWETIGRSLREFFDRLSEIRMTIEGLDVVVSGDLAYATYDWTLSGRAGEFALADRGHATAVYRREKPGWRLVHAHYSPLPPAPPGEGAAEAPAAAGEKGGAAKPGPGAARSTPAPGAPASPSPSPAASPAGT